MLCIRCHLHEHSGGGRHVRPCQFHACVRSVHPRHLPRVTPPHLQALACCKGLEEVVISSVAVNTVDISRDVAQYESSAYISLAHTPSTRPSRRDPHGISCLVPKCTHVDHTEHDIDVICTEQGLADVRGCVVSRRSSVVHLVHSAWLLEQERSLSLTSVPTHITATFCGIISEMRCGAGYDSSCCCSDPLFTGT